MKKQLHKATSTIILLALLMLANMGLSAQETSKKEPVKIPKEILETYLGDYEISTGILKIIMEGDSIKADGPGEPPLTLIPKKENRFLLRKFGVDIEFVKGADGKIEKLLMIRADGQTLQAKKIK